MLSGLSQLNAAPLLESDFRRRLVSVIRRLAYFIVCLHLLFRECLFILRSDMINIRDELIYLSPFSCQRALVWFIRICFICSPICSLVSYTKCLPLYK